MPSLSGSQADLASMDQGWQVPQATCPITQSAVLRNVLLLVYQNMILISFLVGQILPKKILSTFRENLFLTMLAHPLCADGSFQPQLLLFPPNTYFFPMTGVASVCVLLGRREGKPSACFGFQKGQRGHGGRLTPAWNSHPHPSCSFKSRNTSITETNESIQGLSRRTKPKDLPSPTIWLSLTPPHVLSTLNLCGWRGGVCRG